MHEILDNLSDAALVLDLGSGPGSFPAEATRARVVRADLERPKPAPGGFVQADATALPFAARTFDALVMNHSLEHLGEWRRALQEAGRVLKRGGAAFVAVPDALSLSDRLYRKVLRRQGGHVNLFDSARELEETLEWYLGLPHLATRELYSSFAFLNRGRNRSHAYRDQLRFGGLPEGWLAAGVQGLRRLAAGGRPRLARYGWAFYFGQVGEAVSLEPRVNVCVRCGAGHAEEYLRQVGAVVGGGRYRCPECGCGNRVSGRGDCGR